MKLIKWNNDFISGVDIIDFQHKILVEKLNELYTYINEEEKCKCLPSLLNELFEYSVYNFSTEESYFDYCYYNGKKSHVEEHKVFRGEIIEFREKIKKEDSMIGYDLLIFLTDWVVNHMLKTDLEFAKTFKESLEK